MGLMLALTGCDRDDQGGESTTHIEPDRLNDRESRAEKASERKPLPEQLGNTNDKGEQKMDIPFLSDKGDKCDSCAPKKSCDSCGK